MNFENVVFLTIISIIIYFLFIRKVKTNITSTATKKQDLINQQDNSPISTNAQIEGTYDY